MASKYATAVDGGRYALQSPVVSDRLQPWHEAYARWLAAQPEAELSRPGATNRRRRGPSTIERQRQAQIECRRPVLAKHIVALEQRPDFVAYFDMLRARGREAQEAYLAATTAKAWLLHEKTIDHCLDGFKKGEPDQRMIETALKPFFKLVEPPKRVEEPDVRPPVVHLHVGGEEAKRLVAQAMMPALPAGDAIPDVEYEVVEVKAEERPADD